jgi:hypothetical protein
MLHLLVHVSHVKYCFILNEVFVTTGRQLPMYPMFGENGNPAASRRPRKDVIRVLTEPLFVTPSPANL